MRRLVMVIDDSPTIRTILEICLRRAGYQVASFEDGVAALRWLAAPEATIPALVLVDLGLPKLDGYEVIKLLKARPRLERTVIVILSRRDGILDRLKGRLVGAQAYVTKPFRTQTILALLQTHLGEDVPSEAGEQGAVRNNNLMNGGEPLLARLHREEQVGDRPATATITHTR